MDRLDELNLLSFVIQEGTLAGAARRMRRSPSAATRILNEMEERLGLKLFVRTTRSITPTDAGLRMAALGRQLLADYQDMLDQVSGDAIELKGKLKLSAPVLFGRRHIVPIVGDFLRRHELIKVELDLSNKTVNLADDQVDAALRIGHLQDSGLVARKVGEVRRILVASPVYLQRRGAPEFGAGLLTHDLIMQSTAGSLMEWRFKGESGEHVLPCEPRMVVTNAESAVDAALQGCGIARVLSYQVQDELRSGALIRLLPGLELPPLPVNIVIADRQMQPQRVRLFIDFLRERLLATEENWSEPR
jgi:DNA-binding transcriptional LysR family regulator